jgi:hypothetical protein
LQVGKFQNRSLDLTVRSRVFLVITL